MANKERIDSLLQDIRELEKEVAAIRDSDFYPVSFFSQSFDLARKILNDLHAVEAEQVDMLRRQMEVHRQLIDAIPVVQPVVTSQPVDPPVIAAPSEAKTEEAPVVTEQVKIKEIPQPIPSDKDIPTEKKTTLFLSEVLEKNQLSDFRKAFNLNDRFRFRRELFHGDEETMNRVIDSLNLLPSYEASVAYLRTLKWNLEDESVADFIKLLEKRFL